MKFKFKIVLMLGLFLFGNKAFCQDKKRLRAIDSLKDYIKTIKTDSAMASEYCYLATHYNNLDSINLYLDKAFYFARKGRIPRYIGYAYSNKAQSLKRKGYLSASDSTYRVGIAELKRYNYTAGIANLYIRYGYSFNNRNQDSTSYYLQKGVELAKKSKDTSTLVTAHLALGNFFFYKPDFQKSLKNYIAGDELCETCSNKLLQETSKCISIARLIGVLLQRTNEPQRSNKYLEKSLYRSRNSNLPEDLKFIKMSIVENYIKSKELDSAYYLINELVNQEQKNVLRSRDAFVYLIRGKVYAKKKDTVNAFNDYNTSLKISKEINNLDILFHTYTAIGKLYNNTGNIKKAEKNFENAFFAAKKLKNPKLKIEVLNSLIDLFNDNIGDVQKELKYVKQKINVLENIDRRSNDSVIAFIETQYQTKQKEQEITLLKTQQEVAAQQQKNQRNLMLVIIGLVSIACVFFYILYKNRQKTNKKLKEIDDFKSKMFTNLSHEFRTPLTVIQGLSTTLEKDLTNYADINTAKTIRKNASLLNEQLKQILAIAAVDKSNLKFNFIQADIVSYIKDLVQLFKSYAKSSGQDIKLSYNPEAIIMDFDADKIQTIFQNLMSNALKFNRQGEVIEVNLEQKDGFVELNISDKGIGIKNEQLDKIFNRFYTTSTETNIEGTGIGLALVKEYVDKLNGEISVISQENKGTTFIVKLPITNTAIKAEANVMPKLPFVYEALPSKDSKNEEQAGTKNKKTILIVEDNKDILLYYKKLLKNKFNVLIAKNGNEALKQLEAKAVDFIISDLAMPEMDGFQFSKTLKQDVSYSHIPLIIVSANVDVKAKTQGYALGIDAYLTKPFKEAELLSIIDNLFKKQEEKNNYFSELLALKQPNEAQEIRSVEINFIKQLQEIALEKHIYTTQQIAEKLNMSRTKLNQKVNTLTNMPVANYIKHIKIEKAKELLLHTKLRVNEIGFEIGYNDASLFGKIFKKETGFTPTQYQEEHKKS